MNVQKKHNPGKPKNNYINNMVCKPDTMFEPEISDEARLWNAKVKMGKVSLGDPIYSEKLKII